MSVRSGDLNRKIQIQAVTRSDDGQGGATETWATIANGTVWAKVMATSAGEEFEGDQMQGYRRYEIVIRYSSDVAAINNANRILYGSSVLKITGVINVEERNESLLISCEEQTV